jgi:hypothetical protein
MFQYKAEHMREHQYNAKQSRVKDLDLGHSFPIVINLDPQYSSSHNSIQTLVEHWLFINSICYSTHANHKRANPVDSDKNVYV